MQTSFPAGIRSCGAVPLSLGHPHPVRETHKAPRPAPFLVERRPGEGQARRLAGWTSSGRGPLPVIRDQPRSVLRAALGENAGMAGGAGEPHTVSKIALHEHPVEPPGGRPPRRPLRYLVLGVLGIFGALYLIDVFGLFGK